MASWRGQATPAARLVDTSASTEIPNASEYIRFRELDQYKRSLDNWKWPKIARGVVLQLFNFYQSFSARRLPKRDDALYWVACEAASTRAIARHVRKDLGVDKQYVSSLGYWSATR